jgi:hypothetical protein
MRRGAVEVKTRKASNLVTAHPFRNAAGLLGLPPQAPQARRCEGFAKLNVGVSVYGCVAVLAVIRWI